MKRITLAVILGLAASIAQADDYAIIDDIWRSTDPLAQRDDYGLLHQGKNVNATDFAPRYKWRWVYYFKANEQLILQPAYVGSMQTASSKELFHARHRDAQRSGPASVAHALSAQRGAVSNSHL